MKERRRKHAGPPGGVVHLPVCLSLLPWLETTQLVGYLFLLSLLPSSSSSSSFFFGYNFLFVFCFFFVYNRHKTNKKEIFLLLHFD